VIEPLTTAERDVLALLAHGRAPKQAAYERGIAISTVRSHIRAAKRKTGARTLEQLVALFAEAEVAR
jgi:DNA-binding CsgD family transcriptional regulator